MVTVKKAIEHIDEERKLIWNKEPTEEILASIRTPGTFGTHFTEGMTVEADLRQLMTHFWLLNNSINRDDVDLGSMKAYANELLKLHISLWASEHWFDKGTKTQKVLGLADEAILQVATKEEFKKVIASIGLFISKMCLYLDARIPWAQLSPKYEDLMSELWGKANYLDLIKKK